jgi:hypothetical protein
MPRWTIKNEDLRRELIGHLRNVRQSFGINAVAKDNFMTDMATRDDLWTDTKSKARDAAYKAAGDAFIAGWNAKEATLTTVQGLAGNAFSVGDKPQVPAADLSNIGAVAAAADLQLRVKRAREGRSDIRAYGIVVTILSDVKLDGIFVVWDGSDRVFRKVTGDGMSVVFVDEDGTVNDCNVPTQRRAFPLVAKVAILVDQPKPERTHESAEELLAAKPDDLKSMPFRDLPVGQVYITADRIPAKKTDAETALEIGGNRRTMTPMNSSRCLVLKGTAG